MEWQAFVDAARGDQSLYDPRVRRDSVVILGWLNTEATRRAQRLHRDETTRQDHKLHRGLNSVTLAAFADAHISGTATTPRSS